jgi:hypothetical protein
MQLQVQQVTGRSPITFAWKESGKFEYDPTDATTSYVYTADAAPLIVSLNTAQSPVATFFGPDGWSFEPGIYRITFIAERAVAAEPLLGTFEVSFSDSQINTLLSGMGERYMSFPIRKL